MKRELPNHTQVPNWILDETLPNLKGSELKVFLVICRQTIGWHKQTDRISISQMQEKTGLSNKGCIDSVKGLIEKELIKKDTINGISSYEINYNLGCEKSSQGVKKVHRGSEKSSQFGSEKSSHTKETITKETITKEREKGNPKFEIIKDALINIPIPEILDSIEFRKAIFQWSCMMWERWKRIPSISTMEANYQHLVNLSSSGEDIIEVINQSTRAENKIFYAVRKFSNKNKRQDLYTEEPF